MRILYAKPQTATSSPALLILIYDSFVKKGINILRNYHGKYWYELISLHV